MAKAMTSEEFIKRAIDVHGSTYDYTDTIYKNMRVKVNIKCYKHGVFKQLPQAHLKGQGCPLCGVIKYKQTMLDKYGVDNPMKVHDIYIKARETCKKRYGYEWAVSSDEIQTKIAMTNKIRYGGIRPLQSDVVRSRVSQTILLKYGSKFIGQVPEIRNKAKETCLQRYGCAEPLASSIVRKKIVKTNQLRYGGISPISSVDVQEKIHNTVKSRYGVDYVTQLDSVIQKTYKSKLERHTFHTSSSEDILYSKLCDIFGYENVLRQYSSYQYPFACDFYIKSRDLYIELNGSWTHGFGWFDNSEFALNIVNTWLLRDTKYYKNAIHVWTEADVKKRNVARKNNLNYIVFWDLSLRDFMLWLALDCPDGQDWSVIYSWLPNPVVDFKPIIPKLTGTAFNLSAVVKAYQFFVFYDSELAMWNENAFYKGIPIRVWLYFNRLQYLHKSPSDISVAELMRGFTISGVLKGYSVFNTSLMDKFVSKYNISSIYDPCAGWGERLLYCAVHNIIYYGVDVNSALMDGYNRMIDDFNLTKQQVICDDSSEYLPNCNVDAILTCPPYGNIEHYSKYGAENLDEISFIDWWSKVVHNSLLTNAKYFVFQINQRWRERMLSVILKQGFFLADEFIFEQNKSSHFNRKNGVNQKHEFESMLVLVRK